MCARKLRWFLMICALLVNATVLEAQHEFVDKYNTGVEALKQNRLDEAIAFFSRALELDPKDHLAYNNRGVAYKKKGLYDKAIEDYNRALDLKSDYPFALVNRGVARYEKGDLDGALQDLTDATGPRKSPKDSAVRTSLAIVKRAKGDVDGALKELRLAITFNRSYAKAYLVLGEILEERKDYRNALDAYDKVFRLSKRDEDTDRLGKKIEELRREYARVLHSRGLDEFRQGDLKKALSSWSEAIKVNPRSVHALRDRGLAQHKAGKFAAAAEDFSSALEIVPNNGELHRVRADAYFKMKKLDKALEDYEKAIALNSRDAVAYNNRAMIFHQRNELDTALREYTQAISLSPGDPTFLENRALLLTAKGDFQTALDDYSSALKACKDPERRASLEKRIEAVSTHIKGVRNNPLPLLPEVGEATDPPRAASGPVKSLRSR